MIIVSRLASAGCDGNVCIREAWNGGQVEMRIVQISQPYPPMISGASLIAAQLAQGLAHKGHDVLVVAASG